MSYIEENSAHSPEAPYDGRMADVQAHVLPADFEPLVDRYEAVIGQRDRFLWQWLHHLFPQFTLSSVPAHHVERLHSLRAAASLFVAVLDDFAELEQDRATFEEAAKVPLDYQRTDPDREGVDPAKLALAEEVWDHVIGGLQVAPRYDEFHDALKFDIRQVCNGMRYSGLVNRQLSMANLEEGFTFDSYNMMMLVYTDMDLMFSTGVALAEVGPVRSFITDVQEMARIGNWVTTWEREVAEGDFTAGVVIRALEEGVVTEDELRSIRDAGDPAAAIEVIDRIKATGIEEELIERWGVIRDRLRSERPVLETVDLGEYLDGMEVVMEYHLASRGLK